ncbi:hypothetical protein Pla144_45520 [Bythopirellula polymerisocia]|uniref:DUF1194 domain-containing protein n=2 Tax=Bythopirellula polymerisocia TaxID=2528003 RepID=A0A5C6CCU2_9BACT|nr:hypothetical protein Pla144_45520 [Bythopirellula polymerisocia]
MLSRCSFALRQVLRPLIAHVVATLMIGVATASAAEPIGRFDPGQDLLLAHFDLKTDVDDVHSVAAIATMLADPAMAKVRCHAVAGAYGVQTGLYVPAEGLFDLVFDDDWSDAHSDRDAALDRVTRLAAETLEAGGTVWVAEAGQSDFTAAVVRRLAERVPADELRSRIVVVQHADWNEEVTTAADLSYVRRTTNYKRIPDGNSVGNGTPGFRSELPVDWQTRITIARLATIWRRAIDIANRYNGVEGRYLNEAIAAGGLDFSDVSEVAWIFGLEDLTDAEAFFDRFATCPAGGRGNEDPSGGTGLIGGGNRLPR